MKKILTLTIALIVFAQVAFSAERVMRYPSGMPTSVLGTDTTASDIPIADAGTIISATEVEGALQENRTALDLNTIHSTDNTQAHTDYLINNGNDTTSGILTSAGIIVGDGQTVGATTNKWLFDDTNGDISTTGNVGIGTTTPNQLLTIEGTLSLKEQASANADTAAYGQLWVKTATPNELWFTDDGGTDTQLGAGGAGDLKADGSVPLTADWDVGAYDITAVEFKGALKGNADTVTTITGLPPDTATTQATQGSITSIVNLATVGTITTGTWNALFQADLIDDDDIDNTADVMSGSFGITIDGGGSAITTGVKGYIEIPYNMTIDRATVLLDQSGSIVVDIWLEQYVDYPPTDADSITSSTPPTVTTAVKSEDTTLTSWTTSVAKGDIIGFNVDSCTTATRAHLIISGDKL